MSPRPRALAAAVALVASVPALAGRPAKSVMVILDEKTERVPNGRQAFKHPAPDQLTQALMAALMADGWSLVLPPPDAPKNDRRAARELAKKAGAAVVITGRVRLCEHPPQPKDDPVIFPLTGVVELVAASTADGVVRAAADLEQSLSLSDQPRGENSYAGKAGLLVERIKAALWPELSAGLAAHLAAR